MLVCAYNLIRPIHAVRLLQDAEKIRANPPTTESIAAADAKVAELEGTIAEMKVRHESHQSLYPCGLRCAALCCAVLCGAVRLCSVLCQIAAKFGKLDIPS